MLLSPLKTPIVDSLLRSAVVLCQFANSRGVHIDNKVGPKYWEGRGVTDLDKVRIVEEKEDR